ncbi:hypothetical protein cyc_04029 [Cyclospora cayetanensis]|uniref:Uncharacterized protein n=1 Tax=Cyclospora cayetanensis TaxID=88456 RepID=A0A1D3CX96_9EIME|nr:hypothetical protein cyc_04029 [Cyclospora cayetanensis]
MRLERSRPKVKPVEDSSGKSRRSPFNFGGENRDRIAMDCFAGPLHPAMETHLPSSTVAHCDYAGECIDPPCPRNPLGALAVYVDVDFPAVLQMFRTALTAAVEEATASLFSGVEGRLKRTRQLHRSLEKFWLFACQNGMHNRIQQHSELFLGSLQHQDNRATQGRSTTASLNSDTTSTSVSCDEASGQCPNKGTSEHRLLPSSTLKGSLVTNAHATAPPLPSALRPVQRDDGSIIAPPLELLAAYADTDLTVSLPDPRQPVVVEAQEHLTPVVFPAFRSARGCVVGLCVRSLLDLYVQAIRSIQPALLPRGSVVLMAAVNVPMMFSILEHHQLLVQPLDLDAHTLMPTKKSLQKAVDCWGSRIKALVCSHLYGGLCNVQPLVDFCTENKLLLIEDCAESFVGDLYRGAKSVCGCTDAVVASIVPIQQPSNIFLQTLRGSRSMYLAEQAHYEGFPEIMLVRGFPSKGEIFKLLRVQPSASLLAVLLRRLESWNLSDFMEQQLRTIGFARRLQNLGLQMPGSGATFKTFWLFPIVTPAGTKLDEFEATLRENGLYAASDATTLVCYSPSPSVSSIMGLPAIAASMMRRIVYLPVNRRSTVQELLRVEAALAKACGLEICTPILLASWGPELVAILLTFVMNCWAA